MGIEAGNPMLCIAHAALPLWGLDAIDVAPIKVRENAVYAVTLRDRGKVALRVHRLGYHSDRALESEAHWCEALVAAGIEVPALRRSRSGRTFEHVSAPGAGDARQVDVFEWIEGAPLGTTEGGVSGDVATLVRNYDTIGQLAARMHNQAQHWRAPEGFARHAWDLEGLAGEHPLWGRFWELDALTAPQRRVFERLRERLKIELAQWGTGNDRFGLIHADLVPENVMVGSDGLRIIDFDDAGHGWHLFEISTSSEILVRLASVRNCHQPVFHPPRAVLCGGTRCPDQWIPASSYVDRRGRGAVAPVHGRAWQHVPGLGP
jgi:Ser/Thr protein kinase RdoA (MazF antagonist)